MLGAPVGVLPSMVIEVRLDGWLGASVIGIILSRFNSLFHLNSNIKE